MHFELWIMNYELWHFDIMNYELWIMTFWIMHNSHFEFSFFDHLELWLWHNSNFVFTQFNWCCFFVGFNWCCIFDESDETTAPLYCVERGKDRKTEGRERWVRGGNEEARTQRRIKQIWRGIETIQFIRSSAKFWRCNLLHLHWSWW